MASTRWPALQDLNFLKHPCQDLAWSHGKIITLNLQDDGCYLTEPPTSLPAEGFFSLEEL